MRAMLDRISCGKDDRSKSSLNEKTVIHEQSLEAHRFQFGIRLQNKVICKIHVHELPNQGTNVNIPVVRGNAQFQPAFHTNCWQDD